MKVLIATLSLATLMGLSAVAGAADLQGMLYFTGNIIQGGCSAGRPGEEGSGQPHRVLEVAPGVSVQIRRVENACAGHWPVSTRYVALAPQRNQPPGGVVIVSYR